MSKREILTMTDKLSPFPPEIDSLAVFRKTKQSFYLDESIIKGEPQKGKTLYFGTGLASVNGESQGFGVDFLSTFCTAVWLKQKFNYDYVIHEISTEGYNISQEARDNLIKHEGRVIQTMIQNLGLESSYRLRFSYEYHQSNEFKQIKDFVTESLLPFKEIKNYDTVSRYTILQLTGMKFLYRSHQTRMKLGWITDIKEQPMIVDEEYAKQLINTGHLNEFYFDNMYRFVFPQDSYSFLYTPCAIDLKNGGRTVPYTVLEGQARPILNGGKMEEFMSEIENKKLKNKVINSWSENIINLFESLFFEIPTHSSSNCPDSLVLEKIDYIQKEICGL